MIHDQNRIENSTLISRFADSKAADFSVKEKRGCSLVRHPHESKIPEKKTENYGIARGAKYYANKFQEGNDND